MSLYLTNVKRRPLLLWEQRQGFVTKQIRGQPQVHEQTALRRGLAQAFIVGLLEGVNFLGISDVVEHAMAPLVHLVELFFEGVRMVMVVVEVVKFPKPQVNRVGSFIANIFVSEGV